MHSVLPGAGIGSSVHVAARPTRIITYAWGEKYLDLLLSVNVPALLAPGNLPYLAARVPCQLIILTEERLFPRVASHPVTAQVRRHCDLRMMALDDLVAVPDKYGMALSYVLHRGFADLGPAMTDCWQMFLNADFILADGSLRALLPHLARGERLVAAPSYCVNGDAVMPGLRERIDPRTLALAVPPRELAALIMKHRHNTVRGKTINQRAVSMRYMDQFYWEVDQNTLLGHQMPIAIVGLRPQRHVSEPNSYWDHGLMREFCPDAKPCVLGDSDEFLMLELRSEDTAANELSLGWPEPREIASRLIGFITPYQREYAVYPLTLHAADLPAGVEEARTRLDAHVGEVLSHLPQELPSHISHPQWRYHLPGFTRSRHQSLSKRLGMLTTQCPPPDTYSPLDKTWWNLDGLEKSHAQRRKELVDSMQSDLEWLDDALKAPSVRKAKPDEQAASGAEASEGLLGELAALAERATTGVRAEAATEITLHRQDAKFTPPPPNDQELLDIELKSLLDRRRLATAGSSQAALGIGIRDLVERHYERRLLKLDAEYEATRRDLQLELADLMPKEIADAGIPHIEVTVGPQASRPARRLPVRLAAALYHGCFGKMPRVTRLSPHWGALRPVVGLVDAAAASGARNVLVVASQRSAIEDLVGGFAGRRARATPAIVLSENFPLACPQIPDLHFCLCILEHAELAVLPRIVDALAPCMRPGAKIVAVHLSSSPTGLSTDDPTLIAMLPRLSSQVCVHFGGTAATARIATAILGANVGSEPAAVRAARILLKQLRYLPGAFAANMAEANGLGSGAGNAPAICRSVTLEITVADPGSAERAVAATPAPRADESHPDHRRRLAS